MEQNQENSLVEDTKKRKGRKCPRCRGVMFFDPKEGRLSCPNCYRTEDIPSEDNEITSPEEQDFLSAEKNGDFDWGTETKTMCCMTCGIEMIYDVLESVSECPYCGSNQLTETKTENTLAPNGVCMFKLDGKQAAEQFRNELRKHRFCPKGVKEDVKPEAFRGVYLPYWTFDAHTATNYDGEYGIHRQSKAITVTDWFWCRGTGHEFVDDQKASGTNRHDEELLYGILPFQWEENVVYRPEYLAGFATERCSVGLKDAWETAKAFISKRLRRTIIQRIQAEQHGDEVRELNIQTTYTGITYKYLLVPVWVTHIKYRGKMYRFMINGQNGCVSGKVPISPGKLAVTLAGIAAVAILSILWLVLK